MLRQRKEVKIKLESSIFEDLLGPVPQKLDNGKYKVVFRYAGNTTVKSVHLSGSFNEWNKTSLPMTKAKEKPVFEREMILEKGVYEYKFLINGELWKSDPANAIRIGQYQNSVLWVGDD